jgi:hypothetical protein
VSRRPLGLAVLLLGLVLASASSQSVRPSVGGGAMVVASNPIFLGGGPFLSLPLDRQLRLRTQAMLGTQGRSTAARAELALEAVLDPGARGWTGFGVLGVAATSGRAGVGSILVAVGAEWRPAARTGWRLEAGVGGGVRLAVGFRAASLARSKTGSGR